jgi:hypothetical protein
MEAFIRWNHSAPATGGASALTRTWQLRWRDCEGYGEEESPRQSAT